MAPIAAIKSRLRSFSSTNSMPTPAISPATSGRMTRTTRPCAGLSGHGVAGPRHAVIASGDRIGRRRVDGNDLIGSSKRPLSRLSPTMNTRLRLWSESSDQQVSITITSHQQELEEEHAGGPHRGRAAEPGQDGAGHQRLDFKEEQSAEQRRGEERKHAPRLSGKWNHACQEQRRELTGPRVSGRAGFGCCHPSPERSAGWFLAGDGRRARAGSR